ncbi:MAG: NAD(P)/FAD-dependent oxidoreductase [Aestuariivirga sp.]
MRKADLVVVGASFAGLVCARTAAMRGLDVVVIEAKQSPSARIHTTGILVKEADEEIDTPPAVARAIHKVRLYAPSLKSIDLAAPGYYFLTTDTAALIAWLAGETRRAGAEFLCGRKLTVAKPDESLIVLPEFNLSCRFLVGADGARSTVAGLFGLARNTRFLTGLEVEYEDLPGADHGCLHCFLDSKLARGYLAWVAPAPGFFQAGLATSDGHKPDLKAFLAKTESLFGFSGARVKERRSGLIPCGGPIHPFSGNNVMLIGDAAGHVSPMTGGGIRLAFRFGRRAGQLIADHLTRNGPAPGPVLAKELPGFGSKLVMRSLIEWGPPNWLYNLAIGTPVMREIARRIYFHRRAAPGDSFAEFDKYTRGAGDHGKTENL